MDSRIEEVEAVMRRLEQEPEHVLQVRKMAMTLFDPLAPIHGLGESERFVLEAAALLHDIGHVHAPDGKKHHKWSAQMIRELQWKTIGADEIELIACTARYHRKSAPSPEHEEFAALSPDRQQAVKKLAGLLRVADALDRSHLQLIREIKVAVDGRSVTIRPETRGDITAEKEIFQNKAELFEAVLGAKIALSL